MRKGKAKGPFADPAPAVRLTFLSLFIIMNLFYCLRGLWIKNLLPPRTYRFFSRFIFLFLGSILGWGFLFFPGAFAEASENIRVLILKDVSGVKLSGEGLALHDLKTGQTLFKNRIFLIEREAGFRLRLRSPAISAQGFAVDSSAGSVGINGRQYRGTLKIIPGPRRDVWVIDILPLEEYLVGLINYEISSQWPLEAVKAQVVAARTFAFYQRSIRAGEPYDVESGVSDQVYGGVGREDFRSRQAVLETKGELILHRGNPIFAVYSSCCGGKTEPGELMWMGTFPYLRTVECSYCLDSPHFLWNYALDGERLGMALEESSSSAPRVLGLEINERSRTRRVLRVTVRTEKDRRQISGKEFRRLLGYDLLRSTNFVLTQKDGVYLFSGLGWGHGVGLCQWGARGMAEAGMDHRTILKYYYQGVQIGKIPR
jgi:stage II sporulation protein D